MVELDYETKSLFANIQSDLRVGPKTLHYLAGQKQLKHNFNERYIGSLKLDQKTKQALKDSLQSYRKDILRTLHEKGIEYLTIFDKDYPELLRKISTPPFALYVRGKLPKGPQIAIVGSRKVTNYGRRVAADLSRQLAGLGVTVISGLALGVDGIAHQSAVEAKGQTVAVLGGGVDKIYPASNYNLGLSIINGHGALISEFPPGSSCLRHHFPIRNRIIAGLSAGVIVVEAEEKSGSLITARSALEENREVFAVPGSIYSSSSTGPHALIKMGAKLVTSIDDILLEFGLEPRSSTLSSQVSCDSKEESLVVSQLGPEPVSFEALAQRVELEPSVIGSTLTLMEMKGRVKNLGGNQFVLIH